MLFLVKNTFLRCDFVCKIIASLSNLSTPQSIPFCVCELNSKKTTVWF